MQINLQPLEKLARSDGQFLDVHSIFATIQGEGPFTGHPCIFVRLAGCNLQCPSCDTDYTEDRRKMAIHEIAEAVSHVLVATGSRCVNVPLVVITGGEPFRQEITPLVRSLHGRGHTIQIETNGTLHPGDAFRTFKDTFDDEVTVVCSPKASRINVGILEVADCYKYVMHHRSVDLEDGLPLLALGNSALPRVARPKSDVPIYLQPMDSGDKLDNRLSLAACIASCRKYGYILQIQTHKVIGLP